MEQLTVGVLDKIFDGENPDKPVLQFLGHKALNNDRYRLWFSDGISITSYFLIASQYNQLIVSGTLSNFAVCKITNYLLTKAKNATTPVVYIKEIEIIIPGAVIGQQLGNPVTFEPKDRNRNLENLSRNNIDNYSNKITDNISNYNVDNRPNCENDIPETSRVRSQAYVPEENADNSDENVYHVNDQNEVQTQPPVPDESIVTVPIMSLSPYYGRWTIRARVTSKSEIKYWKNARGEGKLFSINIIDESGEMKCTGFNEQVDAFYDLFEEGRIYYITKCQVKPANQRFTTIKHDFELVLNSDTAILIYEGDSPSIPMQQFSFCSIDQIELKDANDVIDVLAVVKSIGNIVVLKAKATGKDLTKRDVVLVDDSNTMVTLTLWGKQAEQFNISDNSVVAVKSVKISEYQGGKSLSSCSSTNIQVNPAIPETEGLLTWFNDSNKAQNAKLISSSSTALNNSNCPWLTFRQVDDLKIGTPESFNMFSIKATVQYIKSQNCIYKACPTEGCKKKLSSTVNGLYRCEKCQSNFPNFVYRMIVQASLFDWTGEKKVTMFGEEAEKVMGMSAQKLGELEENLSTDAYADIFNDRAFRSYNFKIKIVQEHFNDITRLKAVVCNIIPIDDIEYGSRILKDLKALLNKNPL